MKYSIFILFTLVSIILTDTLTMVTKNSVEVGILNTVAIGLIYVSIFILMYLPFNQKFSIPMTIRISYLLWISWCILNLLRGAFLANDYFDWKFLLVNSFSFTFVSLLFFVGLNLSLVIKIFGFVLLVMFPFFWPFIPIGYLNFPDQPELYARLVYPVTFFIVFIPFMKLKWKILISLVAIASFFADLTFRTNMLKITISVMLLGIYYIRNYIPKSFFKWIHLVFFITPIMFLILAVTVKYNIFQEIDKMKDLSITEKSKQSTVKDSRTFLYYEVLTSFKSSKELILGKGANGSYFSNFFGFSRYSSEVAVLNIILRYGILGLSLYFFLLFSISYLAITKSNNNLVKILGLLIATRWSLSFVEEFTQYDLNFYFFFLITGLVTNELFRKMNDNQVRTFFNQLGRW
ncbi:hypothetical protein LCM02_09310 [Lutimonas saemankumensis]|uniref:hypothetical protein n=1 Tax=Lutimonas saemankumensis TaxID=483016 RepID=UPI001CD1E0DB|nr:hypothetical protein [Lutimonas saemankumensis]MCA0932648.1 hypothetical protein [Lutimonas saemankumensis]